MTSPLCCPKVIPLGEGVSVDFRLRNTVDQVGAKPGCTLCRAARQNEGLPVRIFHDQPPGHGGAIPGRFEILDAGDNKHSPFLADLVGGATDAGEVLRIIRNEHAMCVSVVS
jgi:hypothetical protein